KGLLEQGLDVVNIGLVSTPTFYFVVSFYGLDGGLLISASHNPKEYNGIKITRARASPLGKGTGMEELRELAEKEDFKTPAQPGKEERMEGALEEQVKFEEKYADLSRIGRFKIAADAANSMGALYLERLFVDLPQIELVRMNWELDGTFPAHQADPFQEKNVADLRKRVVAEGADLGIATDGDGDRIFFIDNEGNILEPAILRGLMARLFLRAHPGAVICYDIRPGKITEDMILEAGGRPSVTRVGHSLIKKQMLETGAVFGGESSGHFFVKFPHGVYEAPMVVILKLLQELTETGRSLADYSRPLKRYFHSGEINFEIEDKEAALARLREKFKDAELNELDGLTFTYPDFWFNVRASNTESLLRLNLEARKLELVKEKAEKIKKIILG
ncbi:MAG: phosphomannomutase/phosphoglucomutase, partial [Candidatus Magasanikbacteria bacterium]|nr:phosphomannomutase/phosphoglucomutase [Candidatus Magasanikbacteria bacterium]